MYRYFCTDIIAHEQPKHVENPSIKIIYKYFKLILHLKSQQDINVHI